MQMLKIPVTPRATKTRARKLVKGFLLSNGIEMWLKMVGWWEGVTSRGGFKGQDQKCRC